MAKIEIYDKPMCCSTGICGPQLDPVLPRFAADLEWLKTQGHHVERFNLAQQPAAFAENAVVKVALAAESVECLPLILVNGSVVSKAEYPSREQLVELAHRNADGSTTAKSSALPVAEKSTDCCGGSGCG
ncbi:MAG: arsenite efflux transporter metallochaperone ArsD [Planctomycetales bacterium]|nr:arsenite efflux transporter metallochaperone ArsD [Planctomycetales bacterium]